MSYNAIPNFTPFFAHGYPRNAGNPIYSYNTLAYQNRKIATGQPLQVVKVAFSDKNGAPISALNLPGFGVKSVPNQMIGTYYRGVGPSVSLKSLDGLWGLDADANYKPNSGQLAYNNVIVNGNFGGGNTNGSTSTLWFLDSNNQIQFSIIISLQ